MFLSLFVLVEIKFVVCLFVKASCDFEEPNICSFTQDKGDIFDWTRGSGNTTSIKTGPPYDHTYGTSFGKSIQPLLVYQMKETLISRTFNNVEKVLCFFFLS